MMNETTIILLVGGGAERMQPLSSDTTKAMIPFLGKPLLFYTINLLKSYGFKHYIFTSTGKNGEIYNYFENGSKLGIDIAYYSVKKWNHTAGTIKDLVNKMKGDITNTFMVIYGDSLLKVDYKKMLLFHLNKKSKCTILYHYPKFESFLYEYHDNFYENKGRRTNYGVMEPNSKYQIEKFIEKPLIPDIEKEFINPVANATVYIIEKDILDFIPQDHSFDFAEHLFPLLINKGITCFGFDIEDGYRLDIGTIKTYFSAQIAVLNGKLNFCIDYPLLRKDIWAAESATIHSMSAIEKPLIICENSKLNSNCNIRNSIIGRNVYIGNNSQVVNSIILDNTYIGDRIEISDSIIGERVFIDNGIVVPQNTVLGNNCRLGGSELLMSKNDFFGLIRR